MAFLVKEYCNNCGAQINIHYIGPPKIFIIENGQLIRNDNNDTFSLEFLCSENSEHNIGERKDLINWIQSVEYVFQQEKKYDE